jgi:tetratricopeptide (TPR) repeat protein
LIIKAEYQFYHCDINEGVHLYKQAIDSNPLDPTAHHWYSIVLANGGHFEKAMNQIQMAREIDPLISAVISTEAAFLRNLGDYESAVTMHQQAASLGLYGGSMVEVGLDYLVAGEIQKGKDLFLEGRRSNASEEEKLLGLFLEALQDREKLEAFIQYLGIAEEYSDDSTEVLIMLAALGSSHVIAYQSALDCPVSDDALWSDSFREQRSTPEFFEFMQRAGYVGFWREFGWPDDCASLDQNLAECPE